MNSYNNTQIAPYVSNGLANMKAQATPEIVNCVVNSLAPFLNSMNAMALNSCATMEKMVYQLM
jgi:hypothetical protein